MMLLVFKMTMMRLCVLLIKGQFKDVTMEAMTSQLEKIVSRHNSQLGIPVTSERLYNSFA